MPPSSEGAPSAGESEPRVVLVTAPDEACGLRLARGMVADRRAACVNVVPGVTSVYRWEDGVEEDAEVLLVVKTTAGAARALETWLAREHPYDVPECVVLDPSAVEARYRAWLLASVDDGPARA